MFSPKAQIGSSMKQFILALVCVFVPFTFQAAHHWVIGPFVRPAGDNPVLKPDSSSVFVSPVTEDSIRWQEADVFNPAAVVRNGEVYLFFRSEDNPRAGIGERTSRIGLAVSSDGIHFKKYKKPVLYPDSSRFMHYDYPGGCEDPRVVQAPDGRYIMMYTSWNRRLARLSVATSRDLYHWTKMGPAFAKADGGKFLDIWSKSGAIITAFVHRKQVAVRIDGKFWMYWGDLDIHLACSSNLIDWSPVLNKAGKLLNVVSPRPKRFDSQLVECGPPAVMTRAGIVLLYNCANAFGKNASRALPRGRYSVGELLLDPANPAKVISRTGRPVFKPKLSDELTGQYKPGTTFAEGLVYFKGKWYLYYGAADSRVNVAIAPDGVEPY